jgi:hypothetical protein
VDRGWPEAVHFHRPWATAQQAQTAQAPIANRSNGGEAKTPRDRADKRKKLKKKYAIKGGKLVERTD